MGPFTDSMICRNQSSGHLVVRCKGCGSRHSTKNIGWCDDKTKVVRLARSLFDMFDERCSCDDPAEFPLVHDCDVDDICFDWETKTFVKIGA